MKRILLFLFSIFLASQPVYAGDYNPFFGDHNRQVGLHLGVWGVNSGVIVPAPDEPVPFYLVHVQYSMPTTFFELPARYSLNVGQTIGLHRKYGWDWDEYSIPMFFLSEDVALISGHDWYAGVGMGVGMQAQQNDRIGSKLLFQFKLFAGMELTESIRGEFFILHMSNGNTADENNSYAWYGIGFTYSF